MTLVVETSQSHVRLAESARHSVEGVDLSAASVVERIVGPGTSASVQRRARARPSADGREDRGAVHVAGRGDLGARDVGACEPRRHAALPGTPRRSGESWARLWRRCAVALPRDPETSLLLRLHVFHLLQMASPNTADLDVGRARPRPARRGLPRARLLGRAVRLPVLNLPLARGHPRAAALPLPAPAAGARRGGARAGCRARCSRGRAAATAARRRRRCTSTRGRGRWVPDNSHLQRHVSVAIAYNVWQYYQVTGDREFLDAYGAEMLLEIARFWAAWRRTNEASGRYEIHGVMGPTSSTTATRTPSEPGLDNNAYTNVMAVWVLRGPLEVLELLPEPRRAELLEQLGVGAGELGALGRASSRRLVVPFHDDGDASASSRATTDLAELDWDGYRAALRRHPAPRPDPRGRGRHARTATSSPSRPTC